jgi:hypothetical protein
MRHVGAARLNLRRGVPHRRETLSSFYAETANGHKKKDKKTNNDQQNTTQKAKVTRIPQNTGDELRFLQKGRQFMLHYLYPSDNHVYVPFVVHSHNTVLPYLFHDLSSDFKEK